MCRVCQNATVFLISILSEPSKGKETERGKNLKYKIKEREHINILFSFRDEQNNLNIIILNKAEAGEEGVGNGSYFSNCSPRD